MTPPPPLVRRLDALQARVMATAAAGRLTLTCRLLLAMAFLPSGLVKLLGERFTLLSVETPVGFFFEALYRSGSYWRFLGAAQVAAALLLLFPGTLFWGALLFLPLIVNIAWITIAMDFRGTPVITVAMLLANLWLLAWEWPRWRGLLWTPGGARPSALPGWSRLEAAGWWLGAAGGIGVVLHTRALLPRWTLWWWLGVGAAGGATVVLAWGRRWRAAARGAAVMSAGR
jgi:hypothetical protein